MQDPFGFIPPGNNHDMGGLNGMDWNDKVLQAQQAQATNGTEYNKLSMTTKFQFMAHT